MNQHSYPSLFQAADRTAASKQKFYFLLLVAQYATLFSASAGTLLTVVYARDLLLAGYIAALLAGSVCALMLALLKPQQQWYHMRALAESCKTLTWRYMMHSEPFNRTPESTGSDQLLSERLFELSSIQTSQKVELFRNLDVDDQVTQQMRDIRDLPFEARKDYYLKHRIDDQLAWYKRKAEENKRSSSFASSLIVVIYLAAMVTAIVQLRLPFFDDQVVWISEPLLVLAASLLGYAQAKRFTELCSSYALTAFEIQKLRSGFLRVGTDTELADYVTEAESAFSREHTQWMARVG